ncbi:hypothetical protein Pint_23472 [Pistacia integerrima]|uniref:Uncharacterized protein n=1 Tax=Pistacia integerrima TaxID=434235 RepID=A0ACC0YMM5_9ROSI|nr:hypothetical protein Pint_23472 [Pistacia integerrima]
MVESWSYSSEGKGLLFSDEVDLPVDSFSRSRKTFMEWESKPSYSFDINKLISDSDAVEGMEFMDLGFTDATRKPFLSSTSGGTVKGEVGCDSRKGVTNPTCLVTSSSFFGEEESGSKISSSCMESNSQDSTLIDLKLGRLVDCVDTQNGEFWKEKSVLSSVRPSLTAKKARTTSSCSQTPLCQVYGCSKNLSSSKDYHKRHKVCEVHTKTPKVIVNGHEQRFCQQCSRFHLLAEFDDSKRSCRKRLAGHNERRRKPQFNILSGKPHKLLQSYQGSAGTKYLGTSLPKGASFVFPELQPGGILFPESNEQANLLKCLKFEEEPFTHPQFATTITNGQLLTKSLLHLQGNERHHNSGIPPWATESYNVCNTPPGISHSSCALSLLSAQSHNLSSHSSGIQMPGPLINQTSRVHHTLDLNFDKPVGVMSLERYATDGLYSSGMNSVDSAQTGSIMVPDAGHAVDLEVEADGVFQKSDLLKARYFLPPEDGTTVDLIQLSSHLKRVEQQRNCMQEKQQNDDLCCFSTS